MLADSDNIVHLLPYKFLGLWVMKLYYNLKAKNITPSPTMYTKLLLFHVTNRFPIRYPPLPRCLV